jgi:hypothetical protein
MQLIFGGPEISTALIVRSGRNFRTITITIRIGDEVQ